MNEWAHRSAWAKQLVRSKWKSYLSKRMSERRSEKMSEGMSKWPISDVPISRDLCRIHKSLNLYTAEMGWNWDLIFTSEFEWLQISMQEKHALLKAGEKKIEKKSLKLKKLEKFSEVKIFSKLKNFRKFSIMKRCWNKNSFQSGYSF